MSILTWLVNRDSEKSTVTVAKETQAKSMQTMREYAGRVSASLAMVRQLDMLLSAPKVEYNPKYNSKATILFDVNGYESIEIIFDKESQVPMCATLQEDCSS